MKRPYSLPLSLVAAALSIGFLSPLAQPARAQNGNPVPRLVYPDTRKTEQVDRYFGVTVPDQETEGADPVTEVHEQITGLLGSPPAVRVGGHAQNVYSPGPHLHDE